jgi:4-hydroxy-3-methylbut-2-enyl diphosphate reductase
MQKRPQLDITLCAPRGFCAGVDRAIQIVELALEKYGAPVYVRHAIVHNKYVVDGLRDKGAVFVEELDEIPTERRWCFPPGVPKSVPATPRRGRCSSSTTCPLVSKVRNERSATTARATISSSSHKAPRGRRTMDSCPRRDQPGRDGGGRRSVQPADASQLAFVTQTTLSVDDTIEIVSV